MYCLYNFYMLLYRYNYNMVIYNFDKHLDNCTFFMDIKINSPHCTSPYHYCTTNMLIRWYRWNNPIDTIHINELSLMDSIRWDRMIRIDLRLLVGKCRSKDCSNMMYNLYDLSINNKYPCMRYIFVTDFQGSMLMGKLLHSFSCINKN